MEKIILVDGNNLLFRSFYATAYTGNLMRNSKGFPTNGLFGFANMINKIVAEEKPTYMIVAFDKGKTFRHKEYDGYKDGRSKTPDELIMQFSKAKELLTCMGIKYYEIENYEADDIIGTFAKFCDEDKNFIGTIISSDKDLLQLISNDIDIKLLKTKDYIRYNKDTFKEEYGIDPIRVIDLKALMGDPSDNIPGVKGIGEKTALKLLQEYETLDNIYNNIDKISGKVKEKLLEDKENAYMSYHLATIVRDVPMDININDLKYLGKDNLKLNEMYEELEFYSLMKKDNVKVETKEVSVKIVKSVDEIVITKPCSIYLEILGNNYHTDEILGMGVYNDEVSLFIPLEVLKQNPSFLTKIDKYTYDLKKVIVALSWQNINIENIKYDAMIASALLDYNVKDDIAYLSRQFNVELPFFDTIYGKTKLVKPDIEIIAKGAIEKAKFIFDTYSIINNKLKESDVLSLYENIELPLSYVLIDMEMSGVNVNRNTLLDMGEEIKIKLELLTKDIYNNAGSSFNIASTKELGVILFEKLGLPHGKKGKTGYSTSIDVLNKLKGTHPIIDQIIEYRALSKLYTTYIEGLMNTIQSDNKIHTIYTQVLTRTGRLSSLEPNLQNIPVRNEYGKKIRKAFVPSRDSVILSSDYSQIELRILAHASKVEALVEAFKNDLDIHSKTASDIFKVDKEFVTKDMRRVAKAVNFGIIYGISSFGLAENLNIYPNEAKKFIDDYFNTYPGVKAYMDSTIKEAYENGYVKTLFNRKREIPELKDKNYMIRSTGERMALNTPIQGTSADIIKLAMIEVHKKFKENNIKSKMIIQVHDELVFDCLKDEMDKVIEIVKDTMENIVKLDVPLKVDIEYGDDWYQAK